MSQPFVGEIRMFGGSFAPAGWMFCDGSILPIAENDTLFQLIGTTYGGDGQSTFALPDLRGRVPLHQGNGYVVGQSGGAETVTLTAAQLAAHTHALAATTDVSSQSSPAGNVLAQSSAADLYVEDTPNVTLAVTSISYVGGSQPHPNLGPYLCVDFIISIYGVFPSQS